jgi:hypothetical protein
MAAAFALELIAGRRPPKADAFRVLRERARERRILALPRGSRTVAGASTEVRGSVSLAEGRIFDDSRFGG